MKMHLLLTASCMLFLALNQQVSCKPYYDDDSDSFGGFSPFGIGHFADHGSAFSSPVVQYRIPQRPAPVVQSVGQLRRVSLRDAQRFDYTNRNHPSRLHSHQVKPTIVAVGFDSSSEDARDYGLVGFGGAGPFTPHRRQGSIRQGSFDFAGQGSFRHYGGSFV